MGLGLKKVWGLRPIGGMNREGTTARKGSAPKTLPIPETMEKTAAEEIALTGSCFPAFKKKC